MSTSLRAAFFSFACVVATASGGLPGQIYPVWNGAEASFPSRLRPAGDFDGDGLEDFLVFRRDHGVEMRASTDGSVLYTYVPTVGLSLLWWGDCVEIGDLDGDGYGDVLVGLPLHDRAEVFSAKTGLPIYVLDGEEGSFFGVRVDKLGDVDGDGFGDFVIGAPLGAPMSGQGSSSWHAGCVSVHSGRTGAELMRRGFNGAPEHQRFGSSVAGVGDVNRDGRPDFAAGAPYHSAGGPPERGVVGVFDALSGTPLAVYTGLNAYDHFGDSIAAAGDVDGDGYDDWMGASTYGPGFNYVQVVSGYNASLIMLFSASSVNTQFGRGLQRNTDYDGDGVDDFVIGETLGGSDGRGRVHVYSGSTFASLASFGHTDLEGFGDSMCPIADLDADGVPELAIGAPHSDGGQGATVGYHIDLRGRRSGR